MSFEISGDEQEQHRIELEHNLQNTELSFHISTDDERALPRRRQIDCSSVEYPRHISEPSLAEYPSFVHRSREYSMGDEDMHGPHHAWSHRTGDDEDGISPFGAETMSTAAHHASAVTISAGLGGGRAARTREPSLSGAEYDPDRPLHAMISGVKDSDPLKSKQQITFDPIVVDDTAELDRLLESGHAPHPQPSMASRSVRILSPPSPGSSSTSNSPGAGQHIPRPRLTDHLRHVSFSPSRPRSAQGFTPTSPIARRTPRVAAELSNKSINIPTPRPSKRLPSTQPPLPAQIRIHPATPSTAGSKFTRMAKGITKDIEATQQHIFSSHRLASSSTRPASVPPFERNPFHDEPEAVPVHPRVPQASRRSSLKDTTRSRVYLPDVTGLTSAVESPLRNGAKYYPYRTDKPRDIEARLLQTLSALQSQLHGLEEENSISRRRVRELELELEDCKRDVVRERTRLIEREEFKKGDVSGLRMAGSSSRAKGKNKARDVGGFVGRPELDDEKLRVRYKEAVDEKKALEALVNSLRSHLTRLTAELSSHQELLAELKKLREQDSRSLQEKSNEILQLREEVQRLAGEVEVLRGVVEEGLKERKASRESIQVDPEDEEEENVVELEEKDDFTRPRQEDEDAGVTQDEDEEEPERHTVIFDPPGDKTIRTDRATLGESTGSKALGVQFVVDEDLDKIAAEVEERRSNISNGSFSDAIPRSPLRRRPINNDNHHHRAATVDRPQSHLRPVEPSLSRPAIVEKTGDSQRGGGGGECEVETPFPRIRGEQLERLFFSVPEHNAKTCGVCYRRRGRRPSLSSFVGQPRYEEGRGDYGDEQGWKRKGKHREEEGKNHHQQQQQQGSSSLPPQTIVARVIRELEDDFTHYKSVYVELADEYKIMDAISDVRKRNTLAQHLREVVDILEQKGNQIASLYGLLTFRDKPADDN